MSNQLQVSGEAKIRSIQGPVVANSGVITALNGDATQYVRGDGTLADFPTSTGGGSSVSYYLNTSVSQGTIGGVAYKQLSKTPISGAGTDVSTSVDGYIASYITDANDPALLEVPAGNFNCEFYFSVNSNAHNPYVYAELYKYDGTTFTLLGSSQSVPEYLTNGTTLSPYYFAIPVATSVLTITDRIAIRIYVNVDGRTVTLHTENNHLCQVVTTFSKGLISLNNLTRQNQFFATGTSGTDFNISSTTATHTFNLPVASATNTGKLSNTDWSTFNNKVPYTGATTNVNLGAFGITASSLNVTNTSTLDGNILLKKAGIAVTTSTYVSQFAASSGVGIGYSDGTGGANFILQTASIYDYTFPAATGTLALTSDLSGYVTLTTTQTISGVKTFSNILIAEKAVILGTGTTTYVAGQTSLNGNANGLTIGLGVTVGGTTTNYAHQLLFPQLIPYSYTFPAATGTVALTSDLGSYVPTTRTISTTAPLQGGGDLSANRTLSITQATTSTNGYLSSTDWNTFNGKQNALTNPVTGTGTTNYHAKFTGTNTIGNSLIWDNGTNVGIGNTNTTYNLDVSGTGRFTGNGYVGGNLGIGTLIPSGIVNGSGLVVYDSLYPRVVLQNSTTGTSTGAYSGLFMVGNDIYFGNSSATGKLYFAVNSSSSAMTITSAGDVAIGTTTVTYSAAGRGYLAINGTTDSILEFKVNNIASSYLISTATQLEINANGSRAIQFNTNSNERMRITSGGEVLMHSTTFSSLNAGQYFGTGGDTYFTTDTSQVLYINRKGNDGTLVDFRRDNSVKGTISVSGETVSYNSFLGSHWSQLQDGSKIEILKGTIIEAIDEMCIWEDETNDRLPKSKISDTLQSKNVYGTFLAWDEDWETSNDFYVAAVGLGYIRVNSSQNISMGDLLQSNGDGTAKIQEDDIMRSSTIAKVVSTQKIETYEDGSYLIAATLHCG